MSPAALQGTTPVCYPGPASFVVLTMMEAVAFTGQVIQPVSG